MIFSQAFKLAIDELEQDRGKTPDYWKWGNLHTFTFRNQNLSESDIAPIEALFNRGSFRVPWGDSIVHARGWNLTEPYEVDWLLSMRMIVESTTK